MHSGSRIYKGFEKWILKPLWKFRINLDVWNVAKVVTNFSLIHNALLDCVKPVSNTKWRWILISKDLYLLHVIKIMLSFILQVKTITNRHVVSAENTKLSDLFVSSVMRVKGIIAFSANLYLYRLAISGIKLNKFCFSKIRNAIFVGRSQKTY